MIDNYKIGITMVPPASAYGWICTLCRFLFRIPHVMVLEGLRIGALHFAIDKKNQESNTVCVYVYLGNKQA